MDEESTLYSNQSRKVHFSALISETFLAPPPTTNKLVDYGSREGKPKLYQPKHDFNSH